MQTELKITLLDIAASEALDAKIREKVAHLEQRFPAVTACHVIVSAPHRHRSTHRLHSVRINVAVPGNTITVKCDDREDAYVLLREAFAAAERDLEKAVGRRSAHEGRERHAAV